MAIKFIVNDKPVSTDAPAATPLLWVIREAFKLTGESVQREPIFDADDRALEATRGRGIRQGLRAAVRLRCVVWMINPD